MSKIYVILVEYCMKLTFVSASKGSNYYKHVEKTYNFRIKSESGKSAIVYEHLHFATIMSYLLLMLRVCNANYIRKKTSKPSLAMQYSCLGEIKPFGYLAPEN